MELARGHAFLGSLLVFLESFLLGQRARASSGGISCGFESGVSHLGPRVGLGHVSQSGQTARVQRSRLKICDWGVLAVTGLAHHRHEAVTWKQAHAFLMHMRGATMWQHDLHGGLERLQFEGQPRQPSGGGGPPPWRACVAVRLCLDEGPRPPPASRRLPRPPYRRPRRTVAPSTAVRTRLTPSRTSGSTGLSTRTEAQSRWASLPRCRTRRRGPGRAEAPRGGGSESGGVLVGENLIRSHLMPASARRTIGAPWRRRRTRPAGRSLLPTTEADRRDRRQERWPGRAQPRRRRGRRHRHSRRSL